MRKCKRCKKEAMVGGKWIAPKESLDQTEHHFCGLTCFEIFHHALTKNHE